MGAKMRGVLRAGVLYFTIIFVIGFALGTIRVLLLVPRLGAVTSELIELPIILTAAWTCAIASPLICKCPVTGGRDSVWGRSPLLS
jgi:hypothetical protein